MHKLILPSHLLAEFVSPTPCPGCGVSPRVLCVRYPQIKIDEAHDELYFVGHCVACRSYDPIRIRLPRLFFGYLLATSAELKANYCLRPDKVFEVIEAGSDGGMRRLATEYAELVRQTRATGRAESISTDWSRLGMDETEFGKFMRRLGFGDDGSASS